VGVPTGFHTLTTYLVLDDAAAAIEFAERAFGATRLLRLTRPDGRILHAEVRIGDLPLMLADRPAPSSTGADPTTSTHGPGFGIHVYVDDPDAAIDRAVLAGAVLLDPAQDTDDGERRGTIRDPFGCTWWIATQRVARTRPELQRLFDARSR